MSFKEGYFQGKALAGAVARFGSILTSSKGVKKRSINTNKYVKELQALYEQVQVSYDKSCFNDLDARHLAASIALNAVSHVDIEPTSAVIEPLYDLAMDLLAEDDLLSPPQIDWNYSFDIEERIELKKELQQLRQVYEGGEKYFDLWANNTEKLLGAVMLELPSGAAFSDQETNLKTSISALLSGQAAVCDTFIGLIFQEELIKLGLFGSTRSKLERNLCEASNIPYEERYTSQKQAVMPSDSRLSGEDVVDQYLTGTVLKKIFQAQLPFAIPTQLRFEHTHILAGTGHGKTQLIQTLILDDLNQGRGFCVIDSQGDLIRNITMLEHFDPQAADSLSDKLVIVDPTDIDYPACLNMFAMTRGLGGKSTSLQKELVLNATIDLYSYLFGSLFGAELTSKQATVFAYIARLMIEIPDANIQTLRELMEDGRKFVPYMEKLEGTARAFFETQFFSTSFGQSKKQVLTRLWSVLANPTLERMFSNTENKIDVAKCLNEGKILLINTSKELLQKEGSQLLGRFFIALLSQAVIKRSSMPVEDRKAYMVYIDEAHEYFDYRLEDILNQARKYKIGFALAHQNLGQLHELKSTVFSSTSVKLAGGVSASDARAISSEMRCQTSDILEAKKGKHTAGFAAYLKNITETPTMLTVPLGLMESEPTISSEAYRSFVQTNRERYCNHISNIDLGGIDKTAFQLKEPAQSTTRSAPPQVEEERISRQKQLPEETLDQPKEVVIKEFKVPQEGKGGIQHRYLQNLVKKIANQRGFKATVEKQVLSGAGQVDVYLEGHEATVACEVSISTDWKWEASNVAKCLASGADQIVVLAADRKQLSSLEDNLSVEFMNKDNLHFFTSEQLTTYLDKLRADAASTEKTVKGYKVKARYSTTSQEESIAKDNAIARVLLGVAG